MKAKNVIVLDPGHGGRDPGACYADIRECDMALALCLAFRPILQDAGFVAFLSRSVDADFTAGAWMSPNDDLRARIRAINRIQADAILSVHLDSFQTKEGRRPPCGLTGYYAASSRDGYRLATCLYAQLVPLPLRDRGVLSDRASRHGRLGILRDTRTVAALVELGYLSCQDDRAWLMVPANQDRLGLAIADGLKSYFAG